MSRLRQFGERSKIVRRSCEVEQAALERRGLFTQFGVEEVQQGVGFGVVPRSLARRASNNRTSSSNPTDPPFHANTPRERCEIARPTVVGGRPISARGTRQTCSTASTGNAQRSVSRRATSIRLDPFIEP